MKHLLERLVHRGIWSAWTAWRSELRQESRQRAIVDLLWRGARSPCSRAFG
jgi:hypothetical protein